MPFRQIGLSARVVIDAKAAERKRVPGEPAETFRGGSAVVDADEIATTAEVPNTIEYLRGEGGRVNTVIA